MTPPRDAMAAGALTDADTATCPVEGCLQPIRSGSRGMCKTHYERHRRGAKVDAPLIQRPRGWSVADRLAFRSEVMESGCIEWRGTLSRGYGRIDIDGRTTGTHRVAYALAFGEIPAGLEIDHLCRNHSCLNPDHLEAVTHRENVLRGNAAVIGHNSKTECRRGHLFTPENTIVRRSGSRMCRACHYARNRRYGQSKKAVS